MRVLYHWGIYVFGFLLQLVAWFHPKARKWVQGRRNWAQQLPPAGSRPWIWFHCASLGEFEQGRNLIEQIKSDYPHYQILLTFFSPSGYEIRKDYALADYVAYLPLDTPANARRWVAHFSPQLAIFIKYELWLNYLQALSQAAVPTLLVAALMRPDSAFFRSPLRSLYRKALQELTHIFVQNTETQSLLENFTGGQQISISGDTRYDRVWATYERSEALPEIDRFVGGRICLMGGSTWPRGETLLLEAFAELKQRYPICLILAPHEIHPHRIAEQVAAFPDQRLRYSEIDQRKPSHEILWIDNIGMLSRLYRHAEIAYVGGGFGTGLHNVLEPTVFGCPVLFGPVYDKFPEAQALLESGGGFSVNSLESMTDCLERLLADTDLRQEIQTIQHQFVVKQRGATAYVMNWCREQGYLISSPS